MCGSFPTNCLTSSSRRWQQFEDYQHPCKDSCDSGMGAPALTGPIHWEPNSVIRQEAPCGCRYGMELIRSCHQIHPSLRSPKSSEYSREWWQKPFTSFILQSNNNYCSAGGRAIAATRAEACLMYAACMHVTRLHNVNDQSQLTLDMLHRHSVWGYVQQVVGNLSKAASWWREDHVPLQKRALAPKRALLKLLALLNASGEVASRLFLKLGLQALSQVRVQQSLYCVYKHTINDNAGSQQPCSSGTRHSGNLGPLLSCQGTV